MTRVTVCVATYRRPRGLDRLLASLASLEVAPLCDEMCVIVVDNDAQATAQAIVERHRDRLPDLVYAVEPSKGYPFALNRLVELALNGRVPLPDYLAFVDDDEWVDPSWLSAFLSCASRLPCVLAGPVLPRFEAGVPDWIREGGFLERPRHPTGCEVRFAGSGNLLVPVAVLESLGAERAFGRALDLGSNLLGADALFSVLVHQHGHEIRWCDDALAYEDVPRERASVRWLITRAFNSSRYFARVVRLTRSSRSELARRAASAIHHIVVGVLLIVPGLVRGRAASLHAARRCAIGAGALVGLLDPMASSPKREDRSVRA